MRILDRHLLIEYLRTFAMALMFLSALVVIVRLLDKDIKKFDEEIDHWTAVKIVAYQAPRRIMEIVPVACFLATFFVLGRMVQDNQLTAMKAIGVSAYRIVMPFLTSTLLICIAFAFFYNKIASPAFHTANLLKSQTPRFRNRNIVFRSLTGDLFYVQNLDLETQEINRMFIYHFDKNGDLDREIFAETVRWTADQWRLIDGFVRRFDDGLEIGFENFADKKIPRLDDPYRFAKSAKDPRAMTIAELKEIIRYKKRIGQATRREEVKMHHKMAYPFAAFVVVLIAAPISIRIGKAGFFAGLVIAFFLNFIYWGVSFATLEGLSESGLLHPIIACWGANFVYGIIGSILLWKTPK